MTLNDHCCGCGVCGELCPKSAITMQKNSQGFAYPIVNSKKCVDCGLCVNNCRFNSEKVTKKKDIYPRVFALKHKSDHLRLNSQSGGAFTAITDFILKNGGVVYGCELIGFAKAVHTRAETKEERDRQRGSKYIQSDISGVFKTIKGDLDSGRYVLFSGTPCQVDAVKAFLKSTDTSKLITVDIICHGVGSPAFWEDYLKNISVKLNERITGATFRNKVDFGWKWHSETINFETKRHDSTLFKTMYVSHLISRKDCSQCVYKTTDRPGDISIGDCWGIKEVLPDFFDDKGISLILVNDEKGMKVFDSLTDINYASVDNNGLLDQSSLKENWKLPKKYSQFWRFYRSNGFEKSTDKFLPYAKSIMFTYEAPTLIERIIDKCIRITNRMIKK